MGRVRDVPTTLIALLRVAVQHDDPRPVIAAAHAELGRPLGLAGPAGEPLACAPSDASGQQALAVATAAARSGLVAPPGWRIVRMERASSPLGFLGIGEPAAGRDRGEPLLEALAELLTDQLRRVALLQAQRDTVLRRLVAPPNVSAQRARREAASVGLVLADAYWAAAVSACHHTPTADVLGRLVRDARACAPPGALAVARGDCLVLLHPDGKRELPPAGLDWFRLVGRRAAGAAPSSGLQVFVGDHPVAIGELSDGVAEIEEIMSLPRRPSADAVVFLRRLALDRLLATIDPAERQAFVREQLGPLLASRSPDVKTLLEVLEAALDFSRHDHAAARCYMHRNTFRHRLRQAEALLGRDLGDPDERLAVHVALRLRRMLAAPSESPPAPPLRPPASRRRRRGRATSIRKVDSCPAKEHVVGVPRQAGQERRSSPRTTVALDLRLSHKAGRPLTARTLDLSAGGAHVLSDRPLRIDEEMHFDVDLPAGGRHIEGTARVLRQERHNMYALRFERVRGDELAELRAFVDATAGAPLH